MERHRIRAAVGTVAWKRIIIAGTCFIFTACALSILAGGAQGKGAAGDISVVMAPQEIRLGDPAVLEIHVTGESSGPPSIPKVEGLRLFPMGQSSRYQSINGEISQTASYLFQVEAEHAGDFILSPVTATVNGQAIKSEPVRLTVSGSGSGAGPARHRASIPPPAPHVIGGGDHAGLSAEEEKEAAFLRVAPLKLRAYVGELIPVEIQAFFRQGLQASLNSLPVFDGNAFAHQELSQKPDQTETIIDGVPYTVLIWHTALSGVKEGEYPVSAALDATLMVPQASPLRDPFGRAFFDADVFNGFFASAREKSVRLTSAAARMRVLPLPKAGRPEDFSGAVGQFSLSAIASPDKGMVGDPITLKMTIKGMGNFDRVSSPSLASSEGWRTYTPTASFKPTDRAGCEGEKVFEQAVIPLNASIDKIPSLVFSYFDTAKEAYATLRTRPIKTRIAPDSQQARVPSFGRAHPKPLPSGTAGASGTEPGPGGLAPIHVGLGSVSAGLNPIFENPWFLGAQGIPLSALFVGLFMGRRNRRLANDPSILRKKKAKQHIDRSVREMDRAIAGHDVQGFFTACRRAAQERLGDLWGQIPESITLAEVKARLGDSAEGIRKVFENADAVVYSGRIFSQEELRDFRDLVTRELRKLRD